MEPFFTKLGTRRTDGRGVSVTFGNSHWRLFISTSCKEHLRIFVSSHFFNVSGDVAVQWRTELVTWVLGAVAKPIETRVPKLLEKEQCDRPSSVWHWYEQGAIQTLRNAMPCLSFECLPDKDERKLFEQSCGLIVCVGDTQLPLRTSLQRTRNVNMPHPTPAPAPHPASCGTSTTSATYKER